MKSSTLISTLLPLLVSANPVKRSTVPGFDVSDYQPNVDMASAYAGGLRFVMIKATESDNYKSPSFSSQYDAATKAGFIRGGYHFAHPNGASGATQAEYFLANGGGWSGDGITLPGMLDLESGAGSGSSECWGLSASSMVSWIQDFVNTYHSKTTVYPILYASPSWWESCTGNSQAFHTTCPLDMADWASSPQSPPGGWPYWTFWQNADTNKYGGDSDEFNGSIDDLKKLASG